MKDLIQRYSAHFIALLAIVAISLAYVPDVLDGKVISQSDITQYKGASKEYRDYKDNTGERILWTNQQFSGMPTYQISGVGLENPLQNLRQPRGPKPWEKIFLMLLCSYLMFGAFKVRPWLALVGAVAMTFVSGNMIIIEAGHNTKALAVAYLPLLIGGVKYILRKKWVLGINFLTIGMALQLLVNHVQITYYTGMIIGIWMIFELVVAIRSKELTSFATKAGVMLACVLIAVAANAVNLMVSNEYAKHTIRGKSEININRDGSPLEEAPSDGLSPSYAFQWSNGWPDIMAMVIPNYAGGRSDQNASYYGPMPFTSGPQYMGVTVFLLAVFGFLLLKGHHRWWILTAIVLGTLLSLGKNEFTWLSDFFFEHVPFYNKFRAPTMALTIVQVCLPIMAILGVHRMLEKNIDQGKMLKMLKYSGIGVGAFLLILTFGSSGFNDLRTPVVLNEQGVAVDNDSRIIRENDIPEEVFEQRIVENRAELLKKDGQRSLLFFAVVFAILWFTVKGNLKREWAIALIGFAILADFWGVDKRYLSSENFKSKSRIASEVPLTSADQQILLDTSYYRVLDLTASPLQSANASHFHKSIGGYSAAKLSRYQELFDWHVYPMLNRVRPDQNPYLNMLNTKYIKQAQQGGQPMAFLNPNAMGNAWFVPEVRVVANADSAILAIRSLQPEQFAILESKHESQLSSTSYTIDSNARISLESYHPEHMVYRSQRNGTGYAVFSEIYYADGWNAYIDGEAVEHAQVNFILRGLEVPGGEHTIEFKFEPATYTKAKRISLAANGLVYLILIGSLIYGIRNELKA